MFKRMAIQLVLALAVVIGVSVATAGVAAAAGVGEQSCRGEANRYTICILISNYGRNDFQIHVGIDIFMSQELAEAIADPPGDPFFTVMWGEDLIVDDFLFSLQETAVWTWSGGLSAEFWAVAQGRLDEDGDKDEVYAQVYLYPPWPTGSSSFRSTTISAFL